MGDSNQPAQITSQKKTDYTFHLTYLPLSEHVILCNQHYPVVRVNDSFLSTIAEQRVEDVVVSFGILAFLHNLQIHLNLSVQAK